MSQQLFRLCDGDSEPIAIMRSAAIECTVDSTFELETVSV
jgi:hypothetical protein